MFGKKWIVGLAAAVVLIGVGQVVAETYLQLHSPVDVAQVPYIFTLTDPLGWISLPVGGGNVDLKGCKWTNIPIPWYANDAHIIGCMGVSNKTCEQAVAAIDGDTLLELGQFYASTGEDAIYWPWLCSFDSDIYYGVDLYDYHSAGGATYSVGDTFDFTDGVCTELPGYMAGSSEVYLDKDAQGWKTDDLFTGTLTYAGTDGGLCVPSPSTLVGLISMGLMGALGYVWRPRRRAA